VIEVYAGPVLFAVTIAATVSITPRMYVVQTVAAITGRGQLPVLLSCMAAVAVNIRMLSVQREVRILVVKGLWLPALLNMTLCAVIPEFFFVNIILPVAIHTGGRCIPVFLSVCMTGAAAGSVVRTL